MTRLYYDKHGNIMVTPGYPGTRSRIVWGDVLIRKSIERREKVRVSVCHNDREMKLGISFGNDDFCVQVPLRALKDMLAIVEE